MQLRSPAAADFSAGLFVVKPKLLSPLLCLYFEFFFGYISLIPLSQTVIQSQSTIMAASQVQELPRKLWEHSDPKSTEMYKFMQNVNRKHGLNLKVCVSQISPISPRQHRI